MTTPGFTLFDTAIGRCGVAWTDLGIIRVQLPEATDAKTRARLTATLEGAADVTPPTAVRRAVDRIRALLEGQHADLSGIRLDMDAIPRFHRQVYDAARTIPPGVTLSYGEVASRVGSPGGARAVGQALGRNPFAIVVPCHRVLAADGRATGFSAHGGVRTKLRLLSIEGADVTRAANHERSRRPRSHVRET
jgi:methylated-DNA-[protein]-cysteine S-methyltransferase